MEQATDDIVNKQLPELKRRMREGTLNVENIDVFCEKGVFDVDNTRRILQAGRDMGLRLNFHGEELSFIGGAEASELTVRLTEYRRLVDLVVFLFFFFFVHTVLEWHGTIS